MPDMRLGAPSVQRLENQEKAGKALRKWPVPRRKPRYCLVVLKVVIFKKQRFLAQSMCVFPL